LEGLGPEKSGSEPAAKLNLKASFISAAKLNLKASSISADLGLGAKHLRMLLAGRDLSFVRRP